MVAGRLLDLLLGLSHNPADVINALRTLLHGLLGCAAAILELVWEVLLEPGVLLDALHADAVDWVAHEDAAHEVQAFPRKMQVAGKAVLDAHDTLQVHINFSCKPFQVLAGKMLLVPRSSQEMMKSDSWNEMTSKQWPDASPLRTAGTLNASW